MSEVGVASHQPDHPDWPSWLTDLWMTLSHPLSLRSHTPQQCHICPAAQSATIWNGLVFKNTKVVTNNFPYSLVSLRMLSLITTVANATWLTVLSKMQILSNWRLLNGRYRWKTYSSFSLQAGLLGCEAVLSSMALMQASSMAAPPKKMMAPLGHGPQQRDGPDRAPQGHMIIPSGMSCPPLVRTNFGNVEWKLGCYMLLYYYCEVCQFVMRLNIFVWKSLIPKCGHVVIDLKQPPVPLVFV